jgi:hypothetical protein
MNQGEYEALMADTTKRIDGDLVWAVDEGHPAALSFRTEISSEVGYPLSVKGYLNRNSQKLTYVLLHRAEGCIYRLDLGTEHPNLDGTRVGEKHKHDWTEGIGIKDAYVPPDITATLDEPVEVWQQFCAEANMTHAGRMNSPPPDQPDMML